MAGLIFFSRDTVNGTRSSVPSRAQTGNLGSKWENPLPQLPRVGLLCIHSWVMWPAPHSLHSAFNSYFQVYLIHCFMDSWIQGSNLYSSLHSWYTMLGRHSSIQSCECRKQSLSVTSTWLLLAAHYGSVSSPLLCWVPNWYTVFLPHKPTL